MIKTIIFDNGGVIVRDKWPFFMDMAASELNISKEELRKILSPHAKKASKGKMKPDTFLNMIIKTVGCNSSSVKYLLNPARPRVKVVDYILSLGKKYKLALLTNELGSFDQDNKAWGLEKVFGKNIFCSSSIGSVKPDPEIFYYVLQKLGIKPQEAIFVDDKEKNVEGAEDLGINSILYKSLPALRKEIERISKND